MSDDNIVHFVLVPEPTNWRDLLRDTNHHDVELTIKYRDGKEKKFPITWEAIETLAKFHNRCAVAEVYELGLYQ